jgi:hypothetical protein
VPAVDVDVAPDDAGFVVIVCVVVVVIAVAVVGP